MIVNVQPYSGFCIRFDWYCTSLYPTLLNPNLSIRWRRGRIVFTEEGASDVCDTSL
jgi:hypothetical protein